MRVRVRAQFSEASGVLSWMQAQTYKSIDGAMADMVVETAKAMRKRIKLKAKYYRKRMRGPKPNDETKAKLNAMNKARAAGRAAAEWRDFLSV